MWKIENQVTAVVNPGQQQERPDQVKTPTDDVDSCSVSDQLAGCHARSLPEGLKLPFYLLIRDFIRHYWNGYEM
jgi:hypothetical protein